MKEMVFGCSGCFHLKRASCLQAGVLQGSEGPSAQWSLVVFVLHHANNQSSFSSREGQGLSQIWEKKVSCQVHPVPGKAVQKEFLFSDSINPFFLKTVPILWVCSRTGKAPV